MRRPRWSGSSSTWTTQVRAPTSRATLTHARPADIDAPIQAPGSGASNEPSQEQIELLAAMGFTPAQAKKALRETVRTVSLILLSVMMTIVLGR